jgi:HAE1 family hydrophobic/amphiphilic exporter-1
VTVAKEVNKALPGIKSSIGHGIHLQLITDQATPITLAIGDILRSGLLGAAFAVLVIFMFLRTPAQHWWRRSRFRCRCWSR